MQKNFAQFSMEDALRLAKSDTGKQLLGLLQTNHAEAASAASESVGKGDYEDAQRALKELMADPQAKALLRLLWEEYYGRNGK